MKKNDLYKSVSKQGVHINIIDEIICKNLSINKKELIFLNDIDDNIIQKINLDIEKYKKGEPIEYILGETIFYSIKLFTNNNVLIPRNDTEVLVEKAIEEAQKYQSFSYIDIGTGSGNIAIAFLLNTKNSSNSFVTDVSQKALEVCKKNLTTYGLEKNTNILESNLLDIFLKDNNLKFEENIIITANLPYVKNNDFINMSWETYMHEPSVALFGGSGTGFELHEKLIQQIIEFKKIYNIKNIISFIEIGFDQNKHSYEYLEKIGIKNVYFKDNGGITRGVKLIF